MNNEEWMGGDGPTQQLWNRQKGMAKSSISPAVGSIDIPELRELLSASCTAAYLNNSVKQQEADAALFAHIDAQIARAREEGFAEGRKFENGQCREELRYQKEKAEAAHIEVLGMLHTERAARKAPDPDDLTRYTPAIDQTHGVAYAMKSPKGSFVLFSDVQALLAQPSQQEPVEDAAQGDASEDEILELSGWIGYEQGRAAGIKEAADMVQLRWPHWDDVVARIRALAKADEQRQWSKDEIINACRASGLSIQECNMLITCLGAFEAQQANASDAYSQKKEKSGSDAENLLREILEKATPFHSALQLDDGFSGEEWAARARSTLKLRPVDTSGLPG